MLQFSLVSYEQSIHNEDIDDELDPLAAERDSRMNVTQDQLQTIISMAVSCGLQAARQAQSNVAPNINVNVPPQPTIRRVATAFKAESLDCDAMITYIRNIAPGWASAVQAFNNSKTESTGLPPLMSTYLPSRPNRRNNNSYYTCNSNQNSTGQSKALYHIKEKFFIEMFYIYSNSSRNVTSIVTKA
ncbi:unnamed protein product [Brachionus calyciflorus]|uniref:Uncharacterized protein n=1 Tax=Brachionus calyciflorus TaxID=104777 RepID=A0A814H5G2_9BILA|nr:unnamed protein product [Brachionus calyciflorus]